MDRTNEMRVDRSLFRRRLPRSGRRLWHRRVRASRAWTVLLLAGACTLVAGCTRGAKVAPDQAYLRRHRVYRSLAFAREPYLVRVSDRTTDARLRSFAAAPPRVRIAPFTPEIEQRWDRTEIELGAPERARLLEAGYPAASPLYEHTLHLTGLRPQIAYHVLVSARAVEETAELRLRTRAAEGAEGAAFSFLVLGDSGSGSAEQRAVARAIARTLDRPGGLAHGVDAVLHLGDAVYDEGAPEDLEQTVFAPYRALLARAPLYVVLGNHDVRTDGGRALLGAFDAGSAERPFWRRTFGPVELLGIDTTRAADRREPAALGTGGGDVRDRASAQRRWLAAALRQPRAPWRFVLGHHPLLSAGTRHGAGRLWSGLETKALRQALHEAVGQVDFVLQGHEHHYERSVPIAPSWISKDGALSVADGATGEHLGITRRPRRHRVRISGRTVFVTQGTGGGLLVDTPATRIGWAALWTAALPLGSPFWFSWLPVGLDHVDRSEAWVQRAGICYGVSRFDVTERTVRLRTWAVDTERARARLIDDVQFTR